MELLIPGLILVALMAWASTRIKRNAAAAYDPETIVTDEFSIRKPEGFLHVLNDDSGMAFRSYSKEFGKIGDKEVRRATLEIERHVGAGIDDFRKRIEDEAGSSGSFEAYLDAGERAARAASTSIIEGGEYYISRKLVTRGGDVWEARGSVLIDHLDELSNTIEAALDSIQVK